MTNFGQNLWSYSLVAVAIFLIATMLYVGSSSSVSFTSLDGVNEFAGVYFAWLRNLIGNTAQITGQAVHLDWAPNITDFNAP